MMNMSRSLLPVMDVRIEGPGYEATVVIDTVINGTSSGGVRIASDIAPEEVRTLAGEMTAKYAFFGLPRGGAKSGIKVSAGLGRDGVLQAVEDFGRRLSPLIAAGIYYPGMDLNCGPDELRVLYRGAGVSIKSVTDTSFYTALSVESALNAVYWNRESGGRQWTLAIEGFGRVAGYLARRLDPSRFRIRFISTIRGAVEVPDRVASGDLAFLRESHGDECVHHVPGGQPLDRPALFCQEFDVFIPAARVASITETIASRLSCRAVVPIANAPYDRLAAKRLHERGIACLPGFVTNAGGVLGSGLKDRGVNADTIEFLHREAYGKLMDRLLVLSSQTGRSPVELAEAAVVSLLGASVSLRRPERWAARLGARLGLRTVVAGFGANKVVRETLRQLELTVSTLERVAAHAG
jgi:glutamate dehydrogenase (NAD(P)+)